jgi:hypothetical protein
MSGCLAAPVEDEVVQVPTTHNEIVLDKTLRTLEYSDWDDNPIVYDPTFAIEAADIIAELELGNITVASVEQQIISSQGKQGFNYRMVFIDGDNREYIMYIGRMGGVTMIIENEDIIYTPPIS